MTAATQAMRQTTFNGVQLCDEPIEQIICWVTSFAGPGFAYVVTPNIDHFQRLEMPGEAAFKQAYGHADLTICDSRIVKKLSLLERQPINNVVPGSDLTMQLLAGAWARAAKILVVGPEQKDIDIVKRKFALANVRSICPAMGFIQREDEVAKCVAAVLSASADLILLAVGSPQQEILASRIKTAGQGIKDTRAMILCVGASWDFLSGKALRAPRFMQVLHLEWLHRACNQPSRLIPRYWRNLLWLLTYVRRALAAQKAKG